MAKHVRLVVIGCARAGLRVPGSVFGRLGRTQWTGYAIAWFRVPHRTIPVHCSVENLELCPADVAVR